MGAYNFGVTGKDRKAFVKVISEILGETSKYLGTPSYSYQIGDYNVGRDGTLTGEYNLSLFVALQGRGYEQEPSKTFHFITPRGTLLIQELFATAEDARSAGYGMYFTHNEHDVYAKPTGEGEHSTYFALVGEPFGEAGADADAEPADELEAVAIDAEIADEPAESDEISEPASETADDEGILEEPSNAEIDTICIEMPLGDFDPSSLDNLCKMVASKEPLIKKALGVDALPIKITENSIAFDWFNASHSQNMMCYAQFLTQLCKTAKTKKRVTAKAQESFENEKFAMRVWLIGLGLVGAEFADTRKLLLENLSGNGAWRYGTPEGKPKADVEEITEADMAVEQTADAHDGEAEIIADEGDITADNGEVDAPADETPADDETLITDTIYDQIMAVRSAGECNMMDATAVQRYANDNDMYELVILIEENRREYAQFILHGKR